MIYLTTVTYITGFANDAQRMSQPAQYSVVQNWADVITQGPQEMVLFVKVLLQSINSISACLLLKHKHWSKKIFHPNPDPDPDPDEGHSVLGPDQLSVAS